MGIILLVVYVPNLTKPLKYSHMLKYKCATVEIIS